MPRDALTPWTGPLLGAATLLLAATTFGLTIHATPPTPPEPDRICALPSKEWHEPRWIQARRVVDLDQVQPLDQIHPLDQLPEECGRYVLAIRRLAHSTCAALPLDARRSLLDATDQMMTAWHSVTPEAMQPLADACHQGHEAIQSAYVQLCPQLTF